MSNRKRKRTESEPGMAETLDNNLSQESGSGSDFQLKDMDDYLKSLGALQKLRDLAGGELNLPQICVVGDQSSGKSTLLALLTGVQFPTSSGICTKAAIVVQCKFNQKLKQDKFHVRDPQKNSYVEVTLEQLAKEITNIQNAALANCGSKKISQEEIKIQVEGPNQFDIIVIDLPGIINQGEGMTETRDLINKYITQPQTLMLLVSEAQQDAELTTAIGMCTKVDPDSKRTLRVLTKFDTFDSMDKQQTAINLVNRFKEKEEKKSVLDDKEDSVLAEHTSVNLSPHAVICRTKQEENYDREMENEMLVDKFRLPCERSGIAALKIRLPPIFAELIRSNVPQLEEAISAKLDKAKSDLWLVGANPMNSDVLIRECQQHLRTSYAHLEEKITLEVFKFKEEIHATGEKLKKEWAFSKLRPNVFKCPFFQGQQALDLCMRDIVEVWWKPVLHKYTKNIKAVVEPHAALSLSHQRKQMQLLVAAIKVEWKTACEDMFHNFEANSQSALMKEADFGTVNHYLTQKFESDTSLPPSLIENFASMIQPADFTAIIEEKQKEHWIKDPAYSHIFQPTLDDLLKVDAILCQKKVPRSLDEVKTKMISRLEDAKSLWEKQFKAKTLHEQQQERVFQAIKALWGVEKKTFTDLVLKETREQVLKRQDEFVSKDLFTNDNIQNNAVENRGIVEQRNKLKELILQMNQCNDILDRYFPTRRN